MPDLVTLQTREHACVVTLCRQAKLNAISVAMERELCEALTTDELRAAPCVVFTGGPEVFSAGADVDEIRGQDPAAISAYYRASGDFAERVADLPQPTLSAISGWCLGGGLELALATDFRIADADAVFGLPEVEIGILPSSGGTHRLVRMLGPARAKELILLRDRIDATEARRLGLVTEVTEHGVAPLERALELATRLASLPALAVQVTREVVDVLAEASRGAGLALERLAYGMLAQTGDADRAIAARLRR
ncbi:MAG: enoyl-CoA hydratase/isomerase family protein [Solirubrobacteraceae bacterium]